MGLRPVADRAEAAAAAQIGPLQIGQLIENGDRLLRERGGELRGFVGAVFVPVDDDGLDLRSAAGAQQQAQRQQTEAQ